MELNDYGSAGFPDHAGAQLNQAGADNTTNDDSRIATACDHQLYEIQLNEHMNLEDIYDLSALPHEHYD